MSDWFEQLQQDRREWLASTRKNKFERGIFASIVDKYPDPVHFVYELLQNAEDQGASRVNFRLESRRLIFEHDGNPFTPQDVENITGIGNTQKVEQANKIGRFGLGFKSVFVITDQPEVYTRLLLDDGSEQPFSFRIESLVVPLKIASSEEFSCEQETTFTFPFREAESESLFTQIGNKLQTLGADVLLFLRCITEIEWSTPEASGTYACGEDDEGDATVSSEITVRGQKPETRSANYVIREQQVEWPGADRELHVQLAFRVDDQYQVVADPTAGNLDVFFPTHEPTRLKFRVHGPFLLADNRATIKQGDPLNEHLIEVASELLVECLIELRDDEILNVGAIEVLPIREEDFPAEFMFRPLFDAVAEAFQSEALLPAHSGGYLRASEAKLARGTDLLEIVSDTQLSQAHDETGLHWLSGEITENRTHELWRYVRRILDIDELRADQFCEMLAAPFFNAQPDEWMSRFYVFLADETHASLWNSHYSALRSKPFLRLESGAHVAPPVPGAVANAFLPSEHPIGFPTVKRSLCATPEVIAFLRKLGITEPDLVDEVVQQILPKYGAGKIDVNDEPQLRRDLARILEALKGAKAKGVSAFVTQLAQIPFLRAVNCGSGKLAWRRPRDLYFRSDELEMYFWGNSNAWFLDPIYVEHHQQLAALGIDSSVRVSFRPPGWNGHITIADQHSYHKRGLSGFDPDCKIDGLDHALRIPNEDRSRFIWNRLLKEHIKQIRGLVESSSRQTYEASTKTRVPSVMGKLVIEHPWLPSRAGGWHKPSELGVEDLPEGFEQSESLAEKLGMRSSALGQLARQKNIPPDKLQVLIDHLSDPELQRFIAKKSKEPPPPPPKAVPEFPVRQVSNIDTRTSRAAEEATDATTRVHEIRERSVRVTGNEIDPRTWLREQYTNDAGIMFCQMQGTAPLVMPFKFRPGGGEEQYFFEKCEFFKGLGRELRANYLALSPDCAAEFAQACPLSEQQKRERLLAIDPDGPPDSLYLELDTPVHHRLRFTLPHLVDLQAAAREL